MADRETFSSLLEPCPPALGSEFESSFDKPLLAGEVAVESHARDAGVCKEFVDA